jgi:hypothetical protein
MRIGIGAMSGSHPRGSSSVGIAVIVSRRALRTPNTAETADALSSVYVGRGAAGFDILRSPCAGCCARATTGTPAKAVPVTIAMRRARANMIVA